MKISRFFYHCLIIINTTFFLLTVNLNGVIWESSASGREIQPVPGGPIIEVIEGEKQASPDHSLWSPVIEEAKKGTELRRTEKIQKAGQSKMDPVKAALERAGRSAGRSTSQEKSAANYDVYISQVMQAVYPNWAFTGRNQDLTCTIKVRIDMQGNLKLTTVSKSSGNQQFDASAINAVTRTAEAGDFPKPPNDNYCELDLIFASGTQSSRSSTADRENKTNYVERLAEENRQRAIKEKREEEERLRTEERKRQEEKRLQEEEKERWKAEQARKREEELREEKILEKRLEEEGKIHAYGPKIFGLQLGMPFSRAREAANEINGASGVGEINLSKDMDLAQMLLTGIFSAISINPIITKDNGILVGYSIPLTAFNYNDSIENQIFVSNFEKNYGVKLQCENTLCREMNNHAGYRITLEFDKNKLIVEQATKESDLLFK